MVKDLSREPSLKEWWYMTHIHNDQWSTLAVEVVYEQYSPLFNDKYKDVEPEKHPPFDAFLWKTVLDGRDVGVHSAHQQALDGLDPHFHSVTSSSSNIKRLPTLLWNQRHRVLCLQLKSTSIANWRLCCSP